MEGDHREKVGEAGSVAGMCQAEFWLQVNHGLGVREGGLGRLGTGQQRLSILLKAIDQSWCGRQSGGPQRCLGPYLQNL